MIFTICDTLNCLYFRHVVHLIIWFVTAIHRSYGLPNTSLFVNLYCLNRWFGIFRSDWTLKCTLLTTGPASLLNSLTSSLKPLGSDRSRFIEQRLRHEEATLSVPLAMIWPFSAPFVAVSAAQLSQLLNVDARDPKSVNVMSCASRGPGGRVRPKVKT